MIFLAESVEKVALFSDDYVVLYRLFAYKSL
jgi:hypothetical protein